MANFEVFCWNISMSANLLFLKSAIMSIDAFVSKKCICTDQLTPHVASRHIVVKTREQIGSHDKNYTLRFWIYKRILP